MGLRQNNSKQGFAETSRNRFSSRKGGDGV